ncbi:MAG: SpoIIE family protein phosphatase [Clostridia bacterium]|nr:SpoIIE family protein phosphatase [Clostridia bacterium]
MLQNISGNYGNSDSIGKDTTINTKNLSINYKDIISKLFSINNIVIYVLTFMISMVGLGTENTMMIAPFGIALVAAGISSGVPIAIIYVSSVLGTSLKFGGNTTLMYAISSIVMLLLVLIKKPVKYEDETEQYKLGGYIFFSILLTSVMKMIFTKFYLYDILESLTLCVTSYIFYKIFVSSISVISQYGKKRVFSIEEVVGASLLIAIAISSFGHLQLMSFSIRNILCIFMVLVLGWRNGILVGGISGITVGVVLGIIGDGNPILIASYAMSGMIAGFLNRFGKIGVILGFIIGNIIIAYSANGGMKNIIQFQEILIASIGLLALPKKTKIRIEDLIPNTKLLPEAVGKIEEGSETILKLSSISKTISDMSDNYKRDNSYDENVAQFEHEVQKAIEDIDRNLLYDYIANNDEDIIQDLFDNIVENGVLTENGMISVLAKHNIYIMNSDDLETKASELKEVREMIKAVNSAFSKCKSNAIWRKRIQENNINMSEQLSNVKAAIDDITDDIKKRKTSDDDVKIKTKLKKYLLDDDILVKNILIKKENCGRYIIKVFTDVCSDYDGNNCPIKKIQRQINKILKEKVRLQNQKCGIRINRDNCEFTYITDDRYIIQTGTASAKKDGTIVSGDMMSQVRLEDGKLLLAISDGMGSGPEARRNSKIAISMLERLLCSGFNKDTSINLINSTILTANKEEMYATLDIEILDLYEGKMQLLKNGACPTYIKKNRNVAMIKSSSLPTGVMKNVRVDTYDKDVEDGDIVVICSDGIIESNNEYANRELWVKHLLEEVETDRPERIADIILKEAIDNNFGKVKDDMSVIVAKILKKS